MTKAAQAALDAHRWQAAMGAIVGSVAAEAMSDQGNSWGLRGLAAVGHGEALLRDSAVPFDLDVLEAMPAAVGLSDQASPLLTDMATVDLIDHVRAWLTDRRVAQLHDPRLAEAADIAATSESFAEAISNAPSVEVAMLVGGLRGLSNGIGDVPARYVSELTAPDGRRGRRYLARFTDRLLGLHRIDWYEPRSLRGPREVLPGLWLSNLYGLKKFVTDHPDGLVLSLCDIEHRIDGHAEQITFHLDDISNPIANPSMPVVIEDLLTEISRARRRGQPVLVHCRHGASRTGLTLRLILVEELGLSADDALTEAQCLWSHTSSWNRAWNREVERRAEIGSRTRDD